MTRRILPCLTLLTAALVSACGSTPEPTGASPATTGAAADDGTVTETSRVLASPRCSSQTYTPGVHPYPSESDWPSELNGRRWPYDVDRHVRVEIRHRDPNNGNTDTVVLDGTILRPRLPEGVLAPVVLWSSPYLGVLDAPIDDEHQQDHSGRPLPINAVDLATRGYVVAGFNIRGTGASGGCFEYVGPREQRDQYELIEWLARQPWSNGRVGMVGQSFDATVALEAAIQNPPSLKTVVVNDAVTDVYQAFVTPQGAIFDDQRYATGPFGLALMTIPPRSNEPATALNHWIAATRERLCPEVREWMTADLPTTGYEVLDAVPSANPLGTAIDHGHDVRHEGFYAARRLNARFSNVRAAVLLTHGFQENLAYAEDTAWHGLLHAPRWMLVGQWGHRVPPIAEYQDRLVQWLDFWLKGEGEGEGEGAGCLPGGVGRVDYQDGQGGWHGSTSWPPAEARSEVLYINRTNGLATHPGTREDSSSRFAAAPSRSLAAESVDYRTPLVRGPTPFCPALDAVRQLADLTVAPGAIPPAVSADTSTLPSPELLFVTPRVQGTPVVLSGNPMASLQVRINWPYWANSIQPMTGGFITIQLFSLGPNFHCFDGTPTDFRYLTEANVDLRFHRGNMRGENFPLNTTVQVRADFQNLSEVIPVGHRLAAIVTVGGQKSRLANPFLPLITLMGTGDENSSHLVLPITQGTFGGSAPSPTVESGYPTRPFLPR